MALLRFCSYAGVVCIVVLACGCSIVRGQTAFTAVSVYQDSACFGVPSVISFLPECQQPSNGAEFACAATGFSTAAGKSLFSVSRCTDDYSQFAASAFGPDNPYYIENITAGDIWRGAARYVTAGSANGFCQTNPTEKTSFRAMIHPRGMTLVMVKYGDTACKEWGCSVAQSRNEWNHGWLSNYGPSSAPPVNHTIAAEYEDSSCSAHATFVSLTSDRACTPQIDHYDPICQSDGNAYSVSDCTQYYAGGWDDLGIINDAFGDTPHLVVEKYAWCDFVDTVADVAVYRLDENCYPNAAGDASHKLTLGHSLTITTYAEAHCMEVASEVTVKRSTILYGGCTDDSKFFLANTKASFSVVAVYEDSACSGTPSQLTFTPICWCDPLNATNTPCQSIGGSLFTVSSCTQDYSAFATTAFGSGNLFVIEEAFSRGYCDNNVDFVTAYAADGSCHTDLDGATSFQAVIDTDSTLVFRTFFDSACTDGRNTATLTKEELASPMCMFESCSTMARLCALEGCWWWACGQKLFLGGLDEPPALGQRTIVSLYEDSSCSSPAIGMTLTLELTCRRQIDHYNPICAQNGAVYSVSDCTQYYVGGWDDIGIIRDAFGDSPYLIVENYLTGRCGDGDSILNVTMYRLSQFVK